MANLIISSQAKSDLIDIWLFIANDNSANADSYLDKLHQIVKLISENPLMGVARNEIYTDIRCFPVDDYMLYYFLNESGIELVRVLHASRDIVNWL